jgi:hypothetical protein
MNYTTRTLTAGQSINLTTGVVTSAPVPSIRTLTQRLANGDLTSLAALFASTRFNSALKG